MTNADLLSLEETLERMADDRELLFNLFQLFVADAPKKLASIAAGFAGDDAYQVERTAHSLKGASATVGAVRLCAVAAELEQAAKKKDLDAMEAMRGILEDVCAQTLKAMESFTV